VLVRGPEQGSLDRRPEANHVLDDSKWRQDTDTVHGTQKPVECMRPPMLNNSKPGDAVYEPFLGSGTTLIAAEATGRICLAVELDPLYVDVAVRRWQAFAGKRATLQANGKAFNVLAAERVKQGDLNEPVSAERLGCSLPQTVEGT
jgi:hypothetical protein